MDLLTNHIRTYAWGSTTAIPELLGVPPTGEPQAELWMGAHPAAPSRVRRQGVQRTLTELIEADPAAELGAGALGRFGPRLPFLFKVLAADKPLSLQVHPDSAQALAGFAAENDRGTPLDAPERNYRDASHKPELICALGDFEALCGFRDPGETVKLLDAMEAPLLRPVADTLRERADADGLREAFTAILTMPEAQRAPLVAAVGAAAGRLAAGAGPFADIGAAFTRLAATFPADPGVVAALLLNHRRLSPGEALYLGAGRPHAYLRGVGVELMANSDNVLRCGLTSKHVDVPELLRVLRFECGPMAVLRPRQDAAGEEVYPAPAPEFRLSRLRLAAGTATTLETGSPQILLCVAGAAAADEAGGARIELRRGQSAFVPGTAGAVTLRAVEPAVVFRAAVGRASG